MARAEARGGAVRPSAFASPARTSAYDARTLPATGCTTSSSETSPIARAQPPVGRAGPATGGQRHQQPAHQGQQHADQRLPPAASAVGHGTPSHSRRLGSRQLQVAHHRQHAQPHARRRARRGSAATAAAAPRRPRPGSGPRRGRWPRGPRRAGRRARRGARSTPGVRRWPTAGPGRPRRRRPAPAPRCRPGPAAPGSASGTEVRAAAGELLALPTEVEVEPLERVGLEPREPRGHRPAGGAVGAEPGGLLDGVHDRRDTGRLGERRPRAPRSAPASSRSTLARPVTSSSRSAAARRSAASRVRVAFFERHPAGDLARAARRSRCRAGR